MTNPGKLRWLLVLGMLAAACGDGGEEDLDAGESDAATIDARPSTEDTGTTTGNDATTPPADGEVDAGEEGDDGGGSADAFVPTRTLATCETPRAVTLTVGANTVMGDTGGGAYGPLDLVNCGSTSATRSPQEVIALTIPGTAPLGLEFDFQQAGTATTFDMIAQFRTGGCTTAPTTRDGTCFDDDSTVTPTDRRPKGRLLVMGGTTVHMIVAGYNTALTSAGPWEASVRLVTINPPTLTTASIRRRADQGPTVTVTGGDVDSDAAGISYQFLDGDGNPVPVRADDPTSIGPFTANFDIAQTGTSFTDATVTLGNVTGAVLQYATAMRIMARDAYGATSAPITSPIRVYGRLGVDCDEVDTCPMPLVCENTRCALTPQAAAVCDGAMNVTLTAPTGTTATSQSIMGNLPAGAGAFATTCGAMGAGSEMVVNVTVPSGRFDLVASTSNTYTYPAMRDAGRDADGGVISQLDTVVSIRRICGDVYSGLVCDDDGGELGTSSRAALNTVIAGTYAVQVDSYRALVAPFPFQLDLSLRPIVAAGASCDPAGILNRCATGTCAGGSADAGTMGTCPAADGGV